MCTNLGLKLTTDAIALRASEGRSMSRNMTAQVCPMNHTPASGRTQLGKWCEQTDRNGSVRQTDKTD